MRHILVLAWITILATGCSTSPSVKTAQSFGLDRNFSGKLSVEQEQKVPPFMRRAFHVEAVQEITTTALGQKLKTQEKLAEEIRDGVTYVALKDYRCVHFPNAVSGMMIVIERYEIKGK